MPGSQPPTVHGPLDSGESTESRSFPASRVDDTTAYVPATGPTPIPEIPRYTIRRQIGEGGMGIVYEAVGPLGLPVALKVIHPHRITPAHRARFQHEARAMMAFDHPHLARIFDYGEFAGGPYFTMRLLSGHTLRERMPDYRSEPAVGLRALLGPIAALAYMHARRSVHRDIKPGNLLVDERGDLCVADLGLIKELNDDPVPHHELSPTGATRSGGMSSTWTQTGARLGTRAYMAPEQANGDHDQIGPPTDVYALGLILSEIAWGDRPKPTADGQLVWPPDQPYLEPRLSAGLTPIVGRCLAHRPADRYPTAAELHDDLSRLLTVREAPPSRRTALVVGGLAVLGLSAWGIRLARGPRATSPPVVPEDAWRKLQAELAESGRIDLLSEAGQWRFGDWVAGPGEWHVGPPESGPIDALGWFESPPTEVRLLEIARGLNDGFRLTIELTQISVPGQMGVYFGRSFQQSERGPSHSLLAVMIQDYGQDADATGKPQRMRRLVGRTCSKDNPGGFTDARPIHTELVGGVPGSWVKIELTVRPTEVNSVVDDLEFPTRTRNELLDTARQLGVHNPGAESLAPTFHPSEGVGLFADHGGIAIRLARLDRLKPKA